jgi:hypothetical protein
LLVNRADAFCYWQVRSELRQGRLSISLRPLLVLPILSLIVLSTRRLRKIIWDLSRCRGPDPRRCLGVGGRLSSVHDGPGRNGQRLLLRRSLRRNWVDLSFYVGLHRRDRSAVRGHRTVRLRNARYSIVSPLAFAVQPPRFWPCLRWYRWPSFWTPVVFERRTLFSRRTTD